MPDVPRRLSVAHGTHTVDLSLPCDIAVGVLVPSIVDLVHGSMIAADEAQQWFLARVGEPQLDPAKTLADNGIRDGDLLLLSTSTMAPAVRRQDDPCRAVIDAVDSRSTPPRIVKTAACLSATVLTAAALAWSGVVTQAPGHLVTAGVIAAAAAVGTVAASRANADPILCFTISVVAVVFAASAGFLAVPAGPSTASALLAAAVACSMSILLLRITGRGTVCLTSLATFTALASAATACAVAWVLPASATGATLAVLSLGALGAAGRLSILLAGLASGASGSDDDLGPNAIAAHQTLTGLVIGSTGAATLGALVDMASSVRGGCPWPIAATFVTVVGLVLVLRARTHIDPRRRTVLAVGGLMTSAAAVALIVISAPRQAYWVCMLAAAVGVGMLGDLNRRPVNPLARRAVDVLEYIALAALVPLASWVAGLYSVVRGLSLP